MLFCEKEEEEEEENRDMKPLSVCVTAKSLCLHEGWDCACASLCVCVCDPLQYI